MIRDWVLSADFAWFTVSTAVPGAVLVVLWARAAARTQAPPPPLTLAQQIRLDHQRHIARWANHEGDTDA